MVTWKKGSKLKSKAELDQVARFVATFANVPSDMTPEDWQADPKVAEHPGRELFVKDCGSCHKIPDLTEGTREDAMQEAPNLFGWGSPQWMARFVHNAGASDLYGYLDEKDQMPAFGSDKLSANDMDMIIRYIKGDYLEPRPLEAPGYKGTGTDVK
jgi:ubiquinol-cytochrome c reductase cytochrome b subunit